MTEADFPWNRIAMISAIAEKAKSHSLGRTKLMKFAYFLQVLRGVPLDYHFTLYSYGPFDSDVLEDLEYAQMLKGVEIQPVRYPGGYGFDIRPGKNVEQIKQKALSFLENNESHVEWVFENFGDLMSADLELASTIVYVDRELHQKKQSVNELCEKVHDIKPHFTHEQISDRASSLKTKSILKSV